MEIIYEISGIPGQLLPLVPCPADVRIKSGFKIKTKGTLGSY